MRERRQWRRLAMDDAKRFPLPDGYRMVTADDVMALPAVADLLAGIPLLNWRQPHSCHDPSTAGLVLTAHEMVRLADLLATRRGDLETRRDISRRVGVQIRQLLAANPTQEYAEILAMISDDAWQAHPVERGRVTIQDVWHDIAGDEDEASGDVVDRLRAGRDAYWLALPGHPDDGCWLVTVQAAARRLAERLRRDGRPRAHWADAATYATIRGIPYSTEAELVERSWLETLRAEAEEMARVGRQAYYDMPLESRWYLMARLGGGRKRRRAT